LAATKKEEEADEARGKKAEKEETDLLLEEAKQKKISEDA
jgi:hypothetical protein